MSSDGADVTFGGRLFQTWGPATGKASTATLNWMPFHVKLIVDGLCLSGRESDASRTSGVADVDVRSSTVVVRLSVLVEH